MNIDECTLEDVHTIGGGELPPCTGFASSALPEAQSNANAESLKTGVSTRNALSTTNNTTDERPPNTQKQPPEDSPHWYALRCTYGREKTAYDYMVARGITAFHPTTDVVKLIDGKRKTVTQSLLPNIFFAYGTLGQIQRFVYDNVNLPFLRFYYRHKHVGNRIEKTPMIVPGHQMQSLRVICSAEAADTIVSLAEVPKFNEGQLVKVVGGAFKGVVGRVARWQGQQRVAVIVEGVATVVTAYVPSAFLERTDGNV